MRVLIFGLQSGNRSGTGRYTIELVKALATLEDAPEMVCLWPREEATPTSADTIDFIRCPSNFISRFYQEQWAGRRLEKKYGADVIHFPASIAASRGDAPRVVTVHDLCYKSHPEWFSRTRVLYYNAFLGWGIYRATRILADSRATADDIQKYYKIPESRIDIIPLGVDTCFHPVDKTFRNRVREQYHLPETFFLFIGTLEPRKNLIRVVEAWSLLGEGYPDLVIAGRLGWKTDLGHFIRKDSSIRRIHLLGHVPQKWLPALYSAATVFVWPSLMEGFGLPPLEAMACGTPVLTSTRLPYISKSNAVVVDPLSVEQLTAAMQRLADNSELRDSLRISGLEKAASFTWKRTAELTRAAYERARQDVR